PPRGTRPPKAVTKALTLEPSPLWTSSPTTRPLPAFCWEGPCLRCRVLLRASDLRRALESVAEHLVPGVGADHRLTGRRVLVVLLEHPCGEDAPRRCGETTRERVPPMPEESH